jgi:hypothetical protein
MACIEGGGDTVDDRPAIIFTGYEDDMKRVLQCNSGLRRRITETFHFENYTTAQLFQIYLAMARNGGFTIVELHENAAIENMQTNFSEELCSKYNAGISKELLSATKTALNRRIMFISSAVTSSKSPVSTADHLKTILMNIVDEDFAVACAIVNNKLNQ